MWLLIGQGFIANTFVTAESADQSSELMLPFVGNLLTLSTFEMLYKSYLARGHLVFLGQQTKLGVLQEQHSPLKCWPKRRNKGWWREVWSCPWFGAVGNLLEPWLFLPVLFMFMWLTALLQRWSTLYQALNFILSVLLTAAIISAYSITLVWVQGKASC
jgi:hypothetical protein